MAITLGTITNSGNRTNSTGFTLSHTSATNAKAVVMIVTGYDSSATDSAISSLTYDGNNATLVTGAYYRSGSGFVGIRYYELPTIGVAKNVVLTMGGTNTDLQMTVVDLVSSTASTIQHESTPTSSDSSVATHTLTRTSLSSASVMLGGIVALVTAVSALSVTTGSEISGSEADMGSQCVGAGWATESSGTATITWTKTSAVASYALALAFKEVAASNGSVTAVVATATTDAVASTQTGTASVSSVVSTVTSSAETPVASGTSSITSIVSTVTATALDPTVFIAVDGSITSILSTVTAEAFASTLSGNASITSIVSTASTDAQTPAISVDFSLLSQVMQSTADAVAGVLSGTANITSELSTATADSNTETISGDGYILHVVSEVTAQTYTPTITGEEVLEETILMTIDSQLVFRVKNSLIEGSETNLDKFGNLTVVELIESDVANINDLEKLTVYELIEGEV